MKPTVLVLALAAALALPASATAPPPPQGPVRDILPDEGLIRSSVVLVRDQADLDAHYYLADETALELAGPAEGVFARYRAGGGEALVLAVAYPAEADAERVYARFGRDFFGDGFDPKARRFLAELESGDFAASARVRAVLVFVLEAPGRKSCDALLGRVEAKARAAF
ncbi:MAG TPA: hypothetical protein PLP83_02540 [Candidatus Aminicenantes bacterium]|nr:hypothetical protein [Candidatus Aminicenantes bacterium]